MSIDLDTATDEEIADLCSESNPQRNIISVNNNAFALSVVKISDTAVVKFGADETEANNQRIARSLLDPNIVRVPKVYR
jgi:hypothetical protein